LTLSKRSRLEIQHRTHDFDKYLTLISRHTKDLFSTTHQKFALQKLILAVTALCRQQSIGSDPAAHTRDGSQHQRFGGKRVR